MDKTLNRDLFNMCMRLRVHQCNLLIEWVERIKTNSVEMTDYVTQRHLDEFVELALGPFDDIISKIDESTQAGIFREFSIILEDQLPITLVDKENIYFIVDLLQLLREDRKAYNKRIVN